MHPTISTGIARRKANLEPGIVVRAKGKVVDAEHDAHGVVRVQ